MNIFDDQKQFIKIVVRRRLSKINVDGLGDLNRIFVLVIIIKDEIRSVRRISINLS
jgi:hypothetical protein